GFKPHVALRCLRNMDTNTLKHIKKCRHFPECCHRTGKNSYSTPSSENSAKHTFLSTPSQRELSKQDHHPIAKRLKKENSLDNKVAKSFKRQGKDRKRPIDED
ncbi:hypothetical protein NPIL_630401, partial [Nephila pilipes]